MSILKSSIGKKLVMSLSGLFLIMFLLVHLGLNITLILDSTGEMFNLAAHFMATNFLIKLMEPVLALGFLVHIVYAFILTAYNRKARPVRYHVEKASASSSWESRNMFVLGVIVLLGLGLHINDFWIKMKITHQIGEVIVGGVAMEDAFTLVKDKLSSPIYAILYIVWFAFLGLHLRHGFWSAFQSVGLNNQIWIKRWKCVASLYAILIAVGFAIIPIFFLIFG